MTNLKVVQNFTYLGSAISSNTRLYREIGNRLAKANQASDSLQKHIATKLSQTTRTRVYRSTELPTFLYGVESWVTYQRQLWLRDRFHQRCLYAILYVHWSEFIVKTGILKLAIAANIKVRLQNPELWKARSQGEDRELPFSNNLLAWSTLIRLTD